jgi:hypothetical protein
MNGPIGNSTSVDNIDRFLEANAAEDFVPVEYKVVEIHALLNDLEANLNALGSEGWELVVWERMSGKAIFSRC